GWAGGGRRGGWPAPGPSGRARAWPAGPPPEVWRPAKRRLVARLLAARSPPGARRGCAAGPLVEPQLHARLWLPRAREQEAGLEGPRRVEPRPRHPGRPAPAGPPA